MASIYIAGERGNMLDGAVFTPSSADANFGTEFLADGDPGTIFRFNAAAANDGIVASMNILLNGGFEGAFVSGVPEKWVDDSTGTGRLTKETGVVDEGVNSVELETLGGGGTAIVRQDILVGAGWEMSITAALQSGAGPDTVEIFVLNLDTGRYLNSSEAWVTAVSAWFTRTATSWATSGPSTFTVEAASVGERAFYTLRVFAKVSGNNQIGFVDDFRIWPHWDFAAIFGAEYPPTVTARIRSDNNVGMSSPTNRVAFTFGRPGIYGEPPATVTEEFVQLYFDGTALEPISVSEWIIGVKRTLPRKMRLPFEAEVSVDLVTAKGRGGRAEPLSLERDASRDFELRTWANDSAERSQLHRELFDAVRWGGGQLVVVPNDAEPDIYYGWVGPASERFIGTIWEIAMSFHAFGFPVRVQ